MGGGLIFCFFLLFSSLSLSRYGKKTLGSRFEHLAVCCAADAVLGVGCCLR
jgi:hypothetical protein